MRLSGHPFRHYMLILLYNMNLHETDPQIGPQFFSLEILLCGLSVMRQTSTISRHVGADKHLALIGRSRLALRFEQDRGEWTPGWPTRLQP